LHAESARAGRLDNPSHHTSVIDKTLARWVHPLRDHFHFADLFITQHHPCLHEAVSFTSEPDAVVAEHKVLALGGDTDTLSVDPRGFHRASRSVRLRGPQVVCARHAHHDGARNAIAVIIPDVLAGSAAVLDFNIGRRGCFHRPGHLASNIIKGSRCEQIFANHALPGVLALITHLGRYK